MTVSGKLLVFAILVLGGGMIIGHHLVRRAATPESASLIEDRGGPAGLFDRTIRFREERYLVRQEPAGMGDRVLLARLDAAGERAESITHAVAGRVVDVHFLELDPKGPPTVVAIVRDGGETGRAEGIELRLDPRGGRAAPLPPLPDALGSRYLGGDEYERQGAFLYRRVSLSPPTPGASPETARLFFDFENHRWVLTQ